MDTDRLKAGVRAVVHRLPKPLRLAAGRTQPVLAASARSTLGKLPGLTGLSGQVRLLSSRVTDLEEELQRNRRVNRELAEVIDLVEEVVVPSVLRNGADLDAVVDKYAASI